MTPQEAEDVARERVLSEAHLFVAGMLTKTELLDPAQARIDMIAALDQYREIVRARAQSEVGVSTRYGTTQADSIREGLRAAIALIENLQPCARGWRRAHDD